MGKRGIVITPQHEEIDKGNELPRGRAHEVSN
jgi:hypothetical protein